MTNHSDFITFRTFPQGGIHPADDKITAALPSRPILHAKKIYLPLGQHIGLPSRPLVKPGDKVKAGQLIAEAGGFFSASLHASVSGTIEAIDNIVDITGYKRKTIVISAEGDTWDDQIDRSPQIKDDLSMSSQQIIEKIKAAGIVGMGGAAFPTHVKLTVSEGQSPAEFLLVNGVECEPFLTSDHRVMLEHPQEILIGIRLLLKAARIGKALIGVEENKPDAIEQLDRVVRKYSDGQVEVVRLKMLYPQGGERQFVKALTGREISPPPKGLPLDVGCVVVNVSTVFAVYEAVIKNKPLIERVVTVTGKMVKNPGNFITRIGVPVRHLLEAAGGIPNDFGKITAGGPMMGRAFADLDAPVTKGMGGLVLYSKADSRRKEVSNCIRCARCVSVCPLGLEPYLISALAEAGKLEKADEERIVSCCDCGCCAYICPARRPLTDHIKIGKAKILDLQRSRRKS